ncbi:MAG: hypothetical protein GH145_04995 [Firmicutes bacterium]|nr:hypothetical protein [Bacillota bacterium]
MTTLPDMAGTPRIVEIKGKEYKVSPLDIDDLAEFETIVRMERNKALFRSLKDSGLENEVIAEAIGATAAKPVSIKDIDDNMGSMIGTRFLMWSALKKNHPEIKLEEMGKLITLENFEDVKKVVSELGGKAVKERKNVSRSL